MRVFVTGATGFIGSAVVRELLSAGHQALGLARDDAKAEALRQTGADVLRGDLMDLEGLAGAARDCDGVAHLAFNHDWVGTTRDAAAEMDLRAVEAMTGVMEGTNKPFVLTSGTALLAFLLPPGQTGTEANIAPAMGRAASEVAVRAAAERGVRGSIIRLPPTVHGAGEKGFVPMLIDVAREKGVAAYVGDGANRWPAVHRLDAARLYRLALENAAPGAILHAVAEEGVPMRAIAETIGAGLSVPARGLTAEEAGAHFGWMGGFVGIDNPTSSAITRASMGWKPMGPELLADMRENGYFG